MAIGDEHFNIEHYVHLSYECRLPGAVEPAVSTSPAHAPLLVVPGVTSSTPTASVEIPGASVAASTAAASISTVPISVPSSSSTVPSQEPPR